MKPFSENFDETLAALGEIKLIERIRSIAEKISPPAPRGIGDDCAVLPVIPEKFAVPADEKNAAPTKKNLRRLTKTDSVVFGKHFDASVAPEDVGRKLVNRNISDVAATGGVPADALLALMMSDDVSVAWFERFIRGVCDACGACAIELSGGDIASAPGPRFFSASLALTAFAENPLLRRAGTRVGDVLFVTGTLGGSILRKHFAFCPRLAEGRFLASLAAGTVRACMDVTDGLLKDHAALLPAGTHAEFDFDALPISDDARALGGDLTVRAFCDGEDYELLFVIAAETAENFEKSWRERFPKTRLTRIAKIAPGAENAALSRRLGAAHAYEHFRSR